MGRHQRGYVYESSNAFHVRYYCLEIIDGAEVRKQRSHRLATKDAKYTSVSCKAVKMLAEEFLRSVNAQMPGQVRADVRISDFFDHEYLPFIRANKRHSTIYAYENLWRGQLEQHFGTRTLAEYRPSDGFKYLMSLKPKLNRNSLARVRSLASAIFGHAVNTGILDSNPWRAKEGGLTWKESRQPEPTVAYTLPEVLAILKALSGRTDAALIFGLSAFAGLRPSESAALRWENVSVGNENVADDALWVRGSAVRGHADLTKTPQSVRPLPLISPVREIMAAYREQCMNPTEGWLFQNSAGGVCNMDSFLKHHVAPVVRAAGLEWYGIYAARRACGTNLVALTGNINAAYQILGNSLAVCMAKYVKPSQEQGLIGMRLLEAAASANGTAKGGK